MPDDVLEIDLKEALGAAEAPSTQQLTLYIPDKDKNGRKVKDLHRWIKEAEKTLAMIGRGSTMMLAKGTWLSHEKDIDSIDQLRDEDMLWEKTAIIYTHINADGFENNLRLLRKILHDFGRETNQGEVVVEFAGRFFRIREYDLK